MEPTPLLPCLGEHVMERLPEAQRAVPDRQDRGLHAAALAVPQQVGPRLSRLAVPVGERDEFLGAIGTVLPSARTPIITSRHTLSASSRTFRWMPSTHRYT